MHLRVEHITKSFGSNVALKEVSFDVGAQEFVCLLGPSGCGKTTLLRLIAGLMPADSGRLMLDGEDLSRLPARKRGFGIVFQSYSLFPAMTVAENVAFGLSVRKMDEAGKRARVAELLDMVGLRDTAERYPWQLSGGQQQRIAIARALAVQPRLLLLDEPLSALDAKVRGQLREEIKQLQRDLKIPTIMVTHDQEEALLLADRIVCMNDGVVAQIGTPEALYRAPASRFVADFMGTSNIVPAADLGGMLPDLGLAAGAPGALVCLRPEDITLRRGGSLATVRQRHFLGNTSRLQVETPIGALWAVELGHSALDVGDRVDLSVAPEACVMLSEG